MDNITEKAKVVAALLRVLANEKRLQILCALIEQPMSVSELAERLGGITQSAVSQHLALLRAHEMVDTEKLGQHVIYRIADGRIEALIQLLKNQYC